MVDWVKVKGRQVCSEARIQCSMLQDKLVRTQHWRQAQYVYLVANFWKPVKMLTSMVCTI
eukprot:3385599-Amphidinium_carterae.1